MIEAKVGDPIAVAQCGQLLLLGTCAGRTTLRRESLFKFLPAGEREGIYTALHYFSSIDTKASRDFKQRFRRAYATGVPVTRATESHYILVHLLASAIKAAGSCNPEKIIDHLAHQRFLAVGGEVRMRIDHHADLPMFLARYLGGRLVVEKSYGIIRPRDQRGKRY